jgi:hypothetical protein
MSSSSAIESAFQGGDDDGDNTLSVSEAASALQRLSGKYIDEGTISSACSSCGVPTSREMDLSEFTEVVRYLESSGVL